jgi:hypothetical protein
MYKKILTDKKSGKKTEIGKQFEYNQIGNHKYEKEDLKILENNNK